MDQILVSVRCPPQNEHINIKKVANSHVGVILKRCQSGQKFMFFFLLLFLLAANFPSINESESQGHNF